MESTRIPIIDPIDDTLFDCLELIGTEIRRKQDDNKIIG